MSQSEEERLSSKAERPETHDEAQKASDALKAQIEAVRRRIHDAKDTLREHARREREPKSFKP